MFRQVVLNLLGATIAGSVRNSVEIVATGVEGNLSVEIKSHRNELTQTQCQ